MPALSSGIQSLPFSCQEQHSAKEPLNARALMEQSLHTAKSGFHSHSGGYPGSRQPGKQPVCVLEVLDTVGGSEPEPLACPRAPAKAASLHTLGPPSPFQRTLAWIAMRGTSLGQPATMARRRSRSGWLAPRGLARA